MIAWIELNKYFFSVKDDIYIAIIYFVPEGSTNLTDDPFTILLEDIAQLPDPCQILACGDYNARTNELPDNDVDDMYGSSGGLEDVLPGSHIDPTVNIHDSVIKMLHSNGWRDMAFQMWCLQCTCHWSKWPKTICGRCMFYLLSLTVIITWVNILHIHTGIKIKPY